MWSDVLAIFMDAAQHGMQCQVATGFSTVVSCSDFAGFSSDYFQRKVGSFFNQVTINGKFTRFYILNQHHSKSEINFCRNHVVDFRTCM